MQKNEIVKITVTYIKAENHQHNWTQADFCPSFWVDSDECPEKHSSWRLEAEIKSIIMG